MSYIRLLRALSHLTSNVSWDGAYTTSLDNLCQHFTTLQSLSEQPSYTPIPAEALLTSQLLRETFTHLISSSTLSSMSKSSSEASKL